MKVYVASSFLNKAHARTVMDVLEDGGHTITYDWTKHEVTDNPDILRAEALEDLHGVAESDVLVLLSPFRFSSAGEATASLILGIPVIIIGTTYEILKSTFLFAFHPLAFVAGTATDALQIMKTLKTKEFIIDRRRVK